MFQNLFSLLKGPHVLLSGLSANLLFEDYCLVASRLLVHCAIDKLPVLVPNCYTNPRLTDELLEQKLKIISESILYFLKSKHSMFQTGYG